MNDAILSSGASRVTIYPGDRPFFSAPLAEAAVFARQRVMDGEPEPLMLGAMRPGHLGREMVTLADMDEVSA